MEETKKSREKRQAHEGKENFKAKQAVVSENPEDATKRYHLGNFKATQLLGTNKHLLKRRAESPKPSSHQSITLAKWPFTEIVLIALNLTPSGEEEEKAFYTTPMQQVQKDSWGCLLKLKPPKMMF